ncbi:MAG: ABC transporter ATP-binding protein [Alphaproteobacteria bacterium]|nr:ABC transporter ATP-binding protein [Alphaproteobacteria bacterium]
MKEPLIKRIKSIHYFDLIATCWRYASDEQRRSTVQFYLMYVMFSIFELFKIFAFGQAINAMQKAGDDLISELLYWFGAILIFELLASASHFPGRIIEQNVAFKIKRNYTENLYRMITKMPMSWHQDHHSGDTINRIKKASNSLFRFAGMQFIYVQTIGTYIFAVISLAIIHWPSAALVFTVSLGIFTMLARFDVRLIALRKEQNQREHFLTSGLFDYISNIFTVITLRLENITTKEIAGRFAKIYPPFKKSIPIEELKWFLMIIIMNILLVTTIILYAFYALSAGDALMIGTVVMIFQYTNRINDTFMRFAAYYYDLIENHTNVQTVQPIFNDYGALAGRVEDVHIGDWKEIKIENLNFTYEDIERQKHQLKDVQLTISKGQKIAFVGESGSGKSTLMALMRGLYQAEGVKTFVDTNEYDGMYPLYPISTLVPQDPEIFENSILYNITAGIEYDNSDIQEAINVACFDSVVPQLANGLDTDISEKGVNLSGGQKQRLALARGILSAKEKRSLILLDEPTSSVDAVTEREIYHRLFAYYNDRCIISSIHRLHLLPEFDYIYVIEDGLITEQGRFSELVTNGGSLQKAWEDYTVEYNDLKS